MRAARAVLSAAALAFAAVVAGQDAQYFTAPSGGAFEFRWDALVRYDSIDLHRQAAAAHNIFRWRSEVRPELDWNASDRFSIGVRALGELSSDSNRTNDARFDNYRSNDARLDRFFIEARPGNFTLLGGQFGMPFKTTSMLWDSDVQVLGGAASWRQPLGTGGAAVTLSSGFFYGPQREHDKSHVAAGQATLSFGPADGVQVEWSEAYWRFTHLGSTARHFLRQNDGEGNPPYYESNFRILDSLVKLKVPLGRFPVTLSADWAHNFGAVTRQYQDGIDVTLRVGQEGTPGDVQIFEVYQYVDRDAVVGAYNTDDWWFHSWYEGHRVGFGVTVLPQVVIRPSVVIARRQDRDRYLHRYLIDVVKLF